MLRFVVHSLTMVGYQLMLIKGLPNWRKELLQTLLWHYLLYLQWSHYSPQKLNQCNCQMNNLSH